ncbi:MAG: hypothetical protein KY432_00920 [Acidobacteria bacterium]|nr:hypothetical protein [Acidobacteriota bacterium]
MRLVYIAGLEHSGTTLLSQLLSRSPNTFSLGEVGSFFSPRHMSSYLQRWGAFEEAHECSCGEKWERCSFWSPLQHLSGLHSDEPLLEKYRELIDYSRSHLPAGSTVVDSSKSLNVLQLLTRNEMMASVDHFLVLLAVKDVRSFTASILRKQNVPRSLRRCIQTFNWWEKAHRDFIAFLHGRREYRIIHYELLCLRPDTVLAPFETDFGLTRALAPDAAQAQSHIVLGNKDFLNDGRDKIEYDYRWFLDDLVSMVYLFHPRARRLNLRLYRIAEKAAEA